MCSCFSKTYFHFLLQVVVARTIGNPKRLMSVATKIAIQMNCKLGGEAWTVHIPVSIFVIMLRTDLYQFLAVGWMHDNWYRHLPRLVAERKICRRICCQSQQSLHKVGILFRLLLHYISLVCFRWYSNVTFQHSGVELIDGLKRCMKGLCLASLVSRDPH